MPLKIHFNKNPIAGKTFRFIVDGGFGMTNISADIGGDTVFNTDCDDPPCHEMIAIPAGAGNTLLIISASDSDGFRDEVSVMIAGTDQNMQQPLEAG